MKFTIVTSHLVGKYLDVCGIKGIRHAVISTGGYREFKESNNSTEDTLLETAKRHGIRFIGPNCIGIIS